MAHRTSWTLVASLIVLLVTAGCAPFHWLGMRIYYDNVDIPPDRITMNIGYDSRDPSDHKRQLDLYTPEGRNWPTVVFIHGGGWAWGDRAQRFGGEAAPTGEPKKLLSCFQFAFVFSRCFVPSCLSYRTLTSYAYRLS